jgi:solute carrier family 24 (sodium/potassium/calcium exchanger), member 6
MAFSACFGGPMLNMLLGVGISGSYIISETGKPYELEFSTTLLISSIGLLAILVVSAIVVPLNDFHLTRKWGICLIMCYVTILVVNVVVELVTHK